MCGLVGIIIKNDAGLTQKDRNMFTQMLYVNALRGFDSTGVYTINKYGNLNMIKSGQEAAKFLETKTYQDIINTQSWNKRIIIGHNRSATKGAKNDNNAHPFIEGNTCLVHNGTLYNHKHLADVDVDSHAICKAFDKDGHKEIIPQLDGAFALIWYAAKEKRLYIARNKERPLYILETDSADYIASESGMLEWLYERTFGKAKEETKYFDTSKVYFYDIDNLKNGFDHEDMPEKKTYPVSTIVNTWTGTKNTATTKHSGIFTKDYKIGERALFDIIKTSEDKWIYTISAEARDVNRTKACCGIPKHSMDAVDWRDLEDAEQISGKVVGESWKDGRRTLIISNVEAIHTYTSLTGIVLTSDEFYTHCCVCSECGDFIDPEEQDGLFWVRKKENQIKNAMCMPCVSKHPHLNKLLTGVDISVF